MWTPGCPNSICWKYFFSPTKLSWHLCWKAIDCKCKGSLLDCLFYSINLHVIFSPVGYSFDYCCFIVSFELATCESTYFFFYLTLQYCIGFAIYQNESATGIHVFRILNPPPSSLPIPSLWVVPVHQPQASSIVHRTWAGDSFHIWYYTWFNAIFPNLPSLSLSHRFHKTDLYIGVSFAVSYTGLLLPSF